MRHLNHVKENYDLGSIGNYLYSGICGNILKYGGILLGVSGVVDDLDYRKVIAGGLAYIIGQMLNQSYDRLLDQESFNVLEKKLTQKEK